MAKTCDDFIAGVKRLASVPASQSLLSDSDFLGSLQEALENKLSPLLLSVRQDYFVTTETEAMVSGTSEYAIPYRSIGRTLRDLKMIDSGGSTRDMTLIALEDSHLFNSSVTPHSFYFKGDKIVVVPTPTSSGLSLLKFYNLAPSVPVLTSAAARVTAIAGGNITVSSVPSTMVSGVYCDFVQAKSGNSILAMDKAITGVNGMVISFASSDVPASLVVGDYIALANESPVVMAPNEAMPYLQDCVAEDVMRSVGDMESMNAFSESAKEKEKALKIMIEPRIQGESTKVLNRRGLLHGRGIRYRRGIFY